MAPFSPSISTTGGDTATSRLLATWMSLIPTLQVRSLSQRWTLDLDTGLFFNVKWNPDHGLALPPLLDGKRLRQMHGRLLLSLHQRPGRPH